MAVKRVPQRKDPSEKKPTNKDRCQVNVRLAPELLSEVDKTLEIYPMTRSDFFVKAAQYFITHPELLLDQPSLPNDTLRQMMDDVFTAKLSELTQLVDKSVDNEGEDTVKKYRPLMMAR